MTRVTSGRRFVLSISAFCLLAGGAGAQVAQQALTVEQTSIPNILIAGRGAGAFPPGIDAIDGSERTPETNYWLPYAITLSNNTSEGIVAMAVRWTLTDLNGNTSDKVMTRSLFQNLEYQIGPGKSVAVLPFWVLTSEQRGFRHNVNAEAYQPQELRAFQNASMIRVALDGVVVASGQFAGPNSAHEYEQLQAESTSGYALASSLLAKRDAGVPVSGIVEWLQQTASIRPAGATSFGDGDWSTARTSQEAALYLGTYKRGGESRMYARAQQELERSHLKIYR